jgi:amino acid adenylation domain-containing protein
MTPRAPQQSYPLSPQQQGMLLHEIASDRPGAYLEQIVCRSSVPLDELRLAAAWRDVVAVYDVLRTTFSWSADGEPVQHVWAEVALPWTTLDWTDLPPADVSQALDSWCGAERRRRFTLTDAPLLRLALIRLGALGDVMVWTYHHVILDGRSLPIVLGDVFARYDEAAAGQSPAPAPQPTFRDYVEWLVGRDWSASEPFWRARVSGLAAPTELAIKPVVPGSPPAYNEIETTLDEAISARVGSFAAVHGLTVNTVIQGAWGLLLQRYSGQSDVVVGVTRAGRGGVPGAAGMVGLLLNTLPLRVRIDPGRTIRDWLGDLRSEWRDMRDHEHTPLTLVQQWSAIPAGRHLFDSVVVFDHETFDEACKRLSPSWATRTVTHHGQTEFGLALIAHGGRELTLRLGFYDDRLEPAQARRAMGHLQWLIGAMVEDALRPVGHLMGLPPDQRRALLVEVNRTEAEIPALTCLHDMVDQQAAATPDAPAVASDTEVWTYRQLTTRANQLAQRLVALGAGPDVPVAVLVSRSPWLLTVLLGILKSGAAYVPLDARYPPERLSAVLNDAAPSVVVTDAAHAARLPPEGRRVLVLDEEWPSIATLPPTAPATVVTPVHLAYILFTSGSTGRPKGVAIEHRAAVNFVAWGRRTFSADALRGVLFSTSVCFDLSVFEIFVTLASGGTVVVVSNIMELGASPIRSRVTLLNTVPSAMAELVRANAVPSSVTTVNLAGEALPDSLVASIYATGTVARVHNLYGPTETTTYSTWTAVDRGSRVSIGRPVDNTQAFILDSTGHPVPFGVTGELFIGGDGLARGYYGRPDLTSDRFVTRDLGDGVLRRLYRTGDRCAWRDDQTLEYQGRFDHQVKVRGFRIELGDIETAIHGYPGVVASVVVVREDSPGDQRIVAYVVGAVPTGDLRAHVRSQLPDYMVPAQFVVLDSLPLTPNGKVDRWALPAPEAPVGRSGAIAPATDLERQIAAIWCDVLNLPQVSMRDNFFEAGGNSLKLMRVHHQLQRFGIVAPIVDLFSHPTIESLAAHVAAAADPAAAGAVDGATRDRAARQRAAAERMRAAGARRGR